MAKRIGVTDNRTAASYDSAFRSTYLGQAHIAGTGPTGETCNECKFFSPSKKEEGKCIYPIMNKAKESFPKQAMSCRFFENKN